MPQGEAAVSQVPPQMPGLTAAEAAARLQRDGPNRLETPRRGAPARAALAVATEPMLLLLAAAAALYSAIGEWLDAAAMVVSVAFVVLLNVYQNLRSERALDALRELTAPRARVLRDGMETTVPADALVVGDVLVLAQGDRVAADARLVAASALQVDESLLTGESVPVDKEADGGQLFAGTFVVRGDGIAITGATGPRTELGRLGHSLATVRRAPGPLRRQIARLVRVFAPLSLAGALLLAGVALLHGAHWREAALAGLTFALATVPEEFPVILSVMFALGAWRMARIHALVKRPDAIETVGCMSVLCTDKTGTLTENRMRVAAVLARDTDGMHRGAAHAQRSGILRTAAHACPPHALDPMDAAVLEAAGADAPVEPPLRFYPFSDALHATAAAVREGDRQRLLCKGAPETIAMLCGLDEPARQALDADIATQARAGFRMLGVAMSDALPASTPPDDIRGVAFTWCGLLALADPLRADVPAAVQRARDAGVRVVLVTGDHAATAAAIAAAAGIATDRGIATGQDIADATPDALRALARRCDVFARVRPDDKLRLVQSLVQAGDVVGMTGDGINDAPALAAAHVGIAMGGRGSDVARHAGSGVLADDHFPTIVDAIALGRAIYDNLRRAVQYVIAVHVPIAGAALLPVLAGMPTVLLPIHVVLLELLIDPASTLLFERRTGGPALMHQPPRPLGAPLLGWANARRAFALGSGALLGSLAAYVIALRAGFDAGSLQAYALLSVLGGNLSVLTVTAWPVPGGAGRFRAIAAAIAATCVFILVAASNDVASALLHLRGMAILPAIVAAGLPALGVMAIALASHWRRRADS